MALKWGIASAGKISHDFVTSIGTLTMGDHEVVAVAARDVQRAKQFAKMHDIPRSYGSYMELANDPEIEVVYIGVLNPQHFEVAMMMLENGKHVLCEKPLCMNESQSKKLIGYAERKRLFLMEAIWSRFFPTYQYLRKQIDNGNLGEITEVNVSFGFLLEDVDRLKKKELGGGTILDLGVYTIQVALWCFREPPKEIHATGKLNEDGVDMEINATLVFSGNRKAIIKTSALGVLENKATVTGTKGSITLNQFWCPTSLVDIDGTDKTWQLPAGKYDCNFPNSIGLRYEAEAVKQSIRSGELQNDNVTHNESLLIAHIQDEIRRQVGVVFPEDSM